MVLSWDALLSVLPVRFPFVPPLVFVFVEVLVVFLLAARDLSVIALVFLFLEVLVVILPPSSDSSVPPPVFVFVEVLFVILPPACDFRVFRRVAAEYCPAHP